MRGGVRPEPDGVTCSCTVRSWGRESNWRANHRLCAHTENPPGRLGYACVVRRKGRNCECRSRNCEAQAKWMVLACGTIPASERPAASRRTGSGDSPVCLGCRAGNARSGGWGPAVRWRRAGLPCAGRLWLWDKPAVARFARAVRAASHLMRRWLVALTAARLRQWRWPCSAGGGAGWRRRSPRRRACRHTSFPTGRPSAGRSRCPAAGR